MSATIANHITIDSKGIARIAGKRIRVIDLVADMLDYGWTADQIRIQHPSLSLAQIHAALTYYYDHQAELDAEIEKRDNDTQKRAANRTKSPIRAKLRRLGKL